LNAFDSLALEAFVGGFDFCELLLYFSFTFPFVFCVLGRLFLIFLVTWWAGDLLGTFREHEPAAGYERVAGKLGADYSRKHTGIDLLPIVLFLRDTRLTDVWLALDWLEHLNVCRG
jgi:hypothetical protein